MAARGVVCRVRPIPVSVDTCQYLWVSLSVDTYLRIGVDTSSHVIRLLVSTVNTIARTPIVSSLYRTKK